MVQHVYILYSMRNDSRNGQISSVSRVEDINKFKSYQEMSEAEIEAQRRSRNAARAGTNGAILTTYIPESFKDPKLHYEWVLDNGIELDIRKQNGWGVCEDTELARKKGCSTGSAIKIPAGQDRNGQPQQLVLMAIHKSFYEDDMAARKNKIKEFSRTIDSGTAIDKSGNVLTDGVLKTREINIS